MRIYTEFIVMYQDMPMPEAKKFCPFMWQQEDFDSDGDYYYDSIDNKWGIFK